MFIGPLREALAGYSSSCGVDALWLFFKFNFRQCFVFYQRWLAFRSLILMVFNRTWRVCAGGEYRLRVVLRVYWI